METNSFIDNCIETAEALFPELETNAEVQAMLDGLFALIARECRDGRIQSKEEVARFCKASVKFSFAGRYGAETALGKPNEDYE